MERLHQVLFIVSVLALSWFAMMAIHELGHIAGAIATGGTVQKVVLHPLTISRTDVSPNPSPLVVVWLGPIIGSVLPIIICGLIPKRFPLVRNTAIFFAGFCLVANGAYIAIGSFEQIGDCGVMLRAGSPQWTLILFGAFTIPIGILLWHRLGSVQEFLSDSNRVDPGFTYTVLGALIVTVGLEFLISQK
ncbi:MAG: hypothetical protein AAF939_13970 [Planctomycetota bacterium]